MEDGDSVLCTKKEANILRQAIYNYCKGYKPVFRVDKNAECDFTTNNYKYRVWKVKNDEEGN